MPNEFGNGKVKLYNVLTNIDNTNTVHTAWPGPEVIKIMLSQMGMKFYLLINVNMPTIVGI